MRGKGDSRNLREEVCSILCTVGLYPFWLLFVYIFHLFCPISILLLFCLTKLLHPCTRLILGPSRFLPSEYFPLDVWCHRVGTRCQVDSWRRILQLSVNLPIDSSELLLVLAFSVLWSTRLTFWLAFLWSLICLSSTCRVLLQWTQSKPAALFLLN